MMRALLVPSFAMTALLALPAGAATPVKLTGAILGEVRNAAGINQMGAVVGLYNRYDQLVRRVTSNEQGRFALDQLPGDLYTIRVQLAQFMPAVRRGISVQAGSESFLSIQLANIFSTIELVSWSPARGTLMSDEWRWALKGSLATRPVLRALPGTSSNRQLAAFRDTRGIVRLAASDGASLATGGTQQDLGTAFALATSIFGDHRVQVSGNVGFQAGAATPTAGFRTSVRRETGGFGSPEVSLTMRQVALPVRAGFAGLFGGAGAPVLRTMTLGMADKVDLLENLRLEYGGSLEAVQFVDRLNYFSPFGRLTYRMGSLASIAVAFSSGVPPAELAAADRSAEQELQPGLAALGSLPRVTLRDGHAHVQRTLNYEAGAQRVAGSRTYRATVFREDVANAAVLLSGSRTLPSAELLTDLGSRSSIFNAGSYQRMGYMAAVEQRIGEVAEFVVAAGYAGALKSSGVLADDSPQSLREALEQTNRPWVTLRASARVPRSGTQISAGYGWTDFRTLMPAHASLTVRGYMQELGWNMAVRQGIPSVPGIPGRLEASAELRNALGQGYLPLSTGDGRRVVLTQQPRALRGGLSLIF